MPEFWFGADFPQETLPEFRVLTLTFHMKVCLNSGFME